MVPRSASGHGERRLRFCMGYCLINALSRYNYVTNSKSTVITSYLILYQFHRATTAALRTVNPTPPSVPSAPFALGTVFQQPRVKGKLHQAEKAAPSHRQSVLGKKQPHLSLREQSTTAPSEAWAAPKLSSRGRHSRCCPAHLLYPPTTSQPWFLRRSIWQMTGWRTT